MATFFTSDTHWHHRNIIGYCMRPFVFDDGQPDIDRMDTEMIKRWNEVVGVDDLVYHLGDFAFGSVDSIHRVREQLHGKIHLILGNHDRHSKSAYRRVGFIEVSRSLSFSLDGQRLILQHHPEPCPPQYDLMLCGHIHERWARQDKCINVGVDVRDFRPVSLSQLTADTP